MKEISLVFPHQLFRQSASLHKDREVYLLEDDLFFSQYPFHSQKLMLHRATMKAYEVWLGKKGYTVFYINTNDKNSSLKNLFAFYRKQLISEVHYTETIDYLLERRLKRYATDNSIQLIKYPSPNFICSSNYISEYFNDKKRYFLTAFYTDQRKRLKVLVENGNPVGGKWTYDEENRKKLPAKVILPPLPKLCQSDYHVEAKQYITNHFSSTYGSLDDFNYPVTFSEAEKCFEDFLQQRFNNYGIYQDAISKEDSYLFHSLLTSSLNIGLLNPKEIIDRAIEYATQNNIPINSLEGFVRQIMGWREYIRALYEREGVKQRTTNFWNFNRPIPKSFWEGNTGIDPLDTVIKRLLRTGYSNHIERLMIVGNFMCLCEFNPDEVHKWFMSLYIDAYDWVMVPNVYGMSQFADGGLMSTKPYISGSNYILKMSNYKKGSWCQIWDGLFWRFMHIHREFFKKNFRLAMLVQSFDKMETDKKNAHLRIADNFLKTIS
ncbi:MAG: cryptochrome/photolyase family protein [Chitinophagaceae bacterium]